MTEKPEKLVFYFPGADYSLSKEEFMARYIVPACRELARKYNAGEPLTEIEQKILRAYFAEHAH